jgi:hypothetical protein
MLSEEEVIASILKDENMREVDRTFDVHMKICGWFKYDRFPEYDFTFASEKFREESIVKDIIRYCERNLGRIVKTTDYYFVIDDVFYNGVYVIIVGYRTPRLEDYALQRLCTTF